MGNHNLCFGAKIRKIVYPSKPQFCYIKVGFIRGYIHVMISVIIRDLSSDLTYRQKLCTHTHTKPDVQRIIFCARIKMTSHAHFHLYVEQIKVIW